MAEETEVEKSSEPEQRSIQVFVRYQGDVFPASRDTSKFEKKLGTHIPLILHTKPVDLVISRDRALANKGVISIEVMVDAMGDEEISTWFTQEKVDGLAEAIGRWDSFPDKHFVGSQSASVVLILLTDGKPISTPFFAWI